MARQQLEWRHALLAQAGGAWAAELLTRDDPVFFCHREAAETAVLGGTDGRLPSPARAENELHKDGLPRIGLKMATGSDNTVVTAMLIACKTIDKVFAARNARFAKHFLVGTPGIAIRDRLGVLDPER